MAGQVSISVTVNGRRYAVACDEGQQQQLQRLAADLDARIARLAGGLGQVGQERLLLLAGLLLADELAEARRGGAPRQTGGSAAGGSGDLDGELRALARRIEALTHLMQPATTPDEPPPQ